MNDRKLLIVGIDPGVTTAYAVLDIDCNLLDIKSSKQLSLSQLISDISSFGKVILVGTDKAKIPHLVEDFAVKFGAQIIAPKDDLSVNEKRAMINNFIVDDEHQADALASSLFAYKSVKHLLDKIDRFVDENKKHHIRNKIKDFVITSKISIKSAVSLLEKKDSESNIMEKIIAEKKLSQGDFLKLYDKLRKYESEIGLMRRHNINLKNRIRNLLDNKPREQKLAVKKPLNLNEKIIKSLQNKINLMEKDLDRHKSALKELDYLIFNIKNFYILKKLDNLGFKEFGFKNRILNIQANDILLVDDPNIFSQDAINLLKNRVFAIVHKKPVSKKIENGLPFVFISSKNLKINEHGHFGFVGKKEFEIEKSKVNWIGKIIDDYRREKELVS